MTTNICENDLHLCLFLETWQEKRQPPLCNTFISLKPTAYPDLQVNRIVKRSNSWSHLSSARHNNSDMDVLMVSPFLTFNEHCHQLTHEASTKLQVQATPPKMPGLMSSELSCAKQKMECGTDSCVLELSKHVSCATSDSHLCESSSHTKHRAPPACPRTSLAEFAVAPLAKQKDARRDLSRAQPLFQYTAEPVVKPSSAWQYPDALPQSASQDVCQISLDNLLHKNKDFHPFTDTPTSTSAAKNETTLLYHHLSLEFASGALEQLGSGSQQWRSSTSTLWFAAEVKVQNELDDHPEVPEGHTMMIRNIPEWLTPKQLHQTLEEIGLGANLQCLYMPQKFSCTSGPLNNGYAFVNLDNAEAVAALEKAWQYKNVFQGRQMLASNNQMVNIVKAKVQGLRENLKQWKKTKTSQIRNKRYRPILLNAAKRFGF